MKTTRSTAAMVTKRPQQKRLMRATFFTLGMLARKSMGRGIEMRYRSVPTFRLRKVQSSAGDMAGWQ